MLPPLVKARLKSRSLVVRPPLGPLEVNVPLLLATKEFCRNSKSIYESPLVLNRSAATITHVWPLVSKAMWSRTLLISVLELGLLVVQPQVFGSSLHLRPPVNELSVLE